MPPSLSLSDYLLYANEAYKYERVSVLDHQALCVSETTVHEVHSIAQS